MIARVLGSCGSRIPGYQSSCLLIDRQLAIDAGGITATMSVDEQVAIDHVLISHAHLDHVCDLAFLADNVMALRKSPIKVWAPAEVLATLKEHLFNDRIWPDLTRIGLNGFPVLDFHCLEQGRSHDIGHWQVRWAKTNHSVFAGGYLLADDRASILYSGDTTTTEAVWQLGREDDRLAAVFVETSFPDRMEEIAIATGHLTPALLKRELEKLDKPDVAVKIFHIKPQYRQEIHSDLHSRGIQCEILSGNEQFAF